MDCLTNIIGVTQNNCPCLQNGLNAEQISELSMSKSGIFLEELEGGLFLRDVVQLDKCLTFINIQKNAINTAIKHFSADLFAKLNQRIQVKKTAFIGEIGKPTYSATLNLNGRLQFVKLTPKKDSDAIVHLNLIRVFLNEETTTNVWLMEMKEGETEGRVILQQEVTTQNGILSVPVNVGLPLKKDGVFVNYFVVYERTGSVNPRNIKVSCGCSGGDAFAKFVEVGGGETEVFSSLSSEKTDIFTHGISLDVQIKCETGTLICREYDGSDAIALVTAFAIQYKAGELVIENVMNSGEVNRFTMLRNEQLWGKRNHFRKEYFDRIDYLSKVIDVSSSDCFICRSDDFFLGHILN